MMKRDVKMRRKLPSARVLRRLLDYDPETGKLIWKKRPEWMFSEGFRARAWNTKWAGKEAFSSLSASGYHVGTIFSIPLLAHRVIICLMTGDWPSIEVDHKNGERVDNRWENLRLVSRVQNMRNMKRRASNSSGVTGVWWIERDQRWIASIGDGRRKKTIGYYKDFENAVKARRQAESDLNYHENHGRVA